MGQDITRGNYKATEIHSKPIIWCYFKNLTIISLIIASSLLRKGLECIALIKYGSTLIGYTGIIGIERISVLTSRIIKCVI